MAIYYGGIQVSGGEGGGGGSADPGLSSQISAHDARLSAHDLALSAHDGAVRSDLSDVYQLLKETKELVQAQRQAQPMPVFDYAQELVYALSGSTTSGGGMWSKLSAYDLPFDCRVFITNRHTLDSVYGRARVSVDGYELDSSIIPSFLDAGAAVDQQLSSITNDKNVRLVESVAYPYNGGGSLSGVASARGVMTQYVDVGAGQSLNVEVPLSSYGTSTYPQQCVPVSCCVRIVPYRYGAKNQQSVLGPFALSSLAGGDCFQVMSCEYTTNSGGFNFDTPNFAQVADWANDKLVVEVPGLGGKVAAYVHARVFLRALQSGTYQVSVPNSQVASQFRSGCSYGYRVTQRTAGYISVPTVAFNSSVPVLMRAGDILQVYAECKDSDITHQPYFPRNCVANDLFGTLTFSSVKIARG